MARNEFDQEDQDAPARRSPQRTTRLAADDTGTDNDVINPRWRERSTRPNPRRTAALPSTRDELLFWLQSNGIRVVAALIAIALVVAIFIVLGQPTQPLGNQGAGRTPQVSISDQERTPQPTLTPRPAGTPAPTAAPTSVPGTTGAQFRVTGTGELGLFLRAQPNTQQAPLKTLPEGSIVTIIGEDVVGPDRVWKHIRDAEGTEGYGAADFLRPAQ